MLRIKDDVDLKELEKFGFKKNIRKQKYTREFINIDVVVAIQEYQYFNKTNILFFKNYYGIQLHI